MRECQENLQDEHSEYVRELENVAEWAAVCAELEKEAWEAPEDKQADAFAAAAAAREAEWAAELAAQCEEEGEEREENKMKIDHSNLTSTYNPEEQRECATIVTKVLEPFGFERGENNK